MDRAAHGRGTRRTIPANAMSCASAVVLDGHVLYGGGVPHREQLPEPGASLRAVEPACGEDDRDRNVDVTAYRDMPATVAVSSKDAYSRLYVAEGSSLRWPIIRCTGSSSARTDHPRAAVARVEPPAA